jgi:N-acetylmuramic acid 6-phosphate etherase
MATTEAISARYRGLDSWSGDAILAAFSDGQEHAVRAVRAAHPAIVSAAEAIAQRSGRSGRLIYVGAGSSGLIAALDGMELGGTFGWPDDRVALVLANGLTLQPGIAGGAEDDAGQGRRQIAELDVGHDDSVIAVAASGSTPFTVAATEAARAAGALTVAVANNTGSRLAGVADFPIVVETGAEVIVGSTRMNAGTAQKAVLNMLSTLTMIRLGAIYDGMMVGLRVENAKLEKRARATVMRIAGCSEEAAASALARANLSVKAAVLVALGVEPRDADKKLAASRGNLRQALEGLGVSEEVR